MQERLLKNILIGFAGEESGKLVDLLYKKQNVNEFLIAKRMNLTINQTRNMLYKLADSGLVQFIRKKDKKKGGWYTYFWTLKTKRCLSKYKEKLEEEMEKLENQLSSRQKERYYYSPLADLEYTEEEAILHDYTCPETGEVLELKDNSGDIGKIKEGITKIQEQIKTLDEEIEIIDKKEEKAKEKRLKEEKRLKDEERKKRRLLREKEKAKEARKAGKTLPKKAKKAVKKTTKKTVKREVKKKTINKKKGSILRRAIKSFSKKK
ncbi:MAG: hypothetical protein ABH864_07000 [archaeon]